MFSPLKPDSHAAGFGHEALTSPERGGDCERMAAKKPAKKSAKKAAGSKRKPNAAFMKEMTPSKDLAE